MQVEDDASPEELLVAFLATMRPVFQFASEALAPDGRLVFLMPIFFREAAGREVNFGGGRVAAVEVVEARERSDPYVACGLADWPLLAPDSAFVQHYGHMDRHCVCVKRARRADLV